MPGKSPIFTPSSILFRPQQKPPSRGIGGFWWRRRVPPPGPNGLLHRQFIAIVRQADSTEYRECGGKLKGRLFAGMQSTEPCGVDLAHFSKEGFNPVRRAPNVKVVPARRLHHS